jgi:hypothetical protein
MDLYVSVWAFCERECYNDLKTSTLFAVVADVHNRAVNECKALSASFQHFNEVLLAHSIHRPPRSVGIFSLADLKAITQWFSQIYFTHYALYQYVFTPAITLSFVSEDPREKIEVPRPLPTLDDAVDEEAHSRQIADLEAQRQRQEEDLIEMVSRRRKYMHECHSVTLLAPC